MASFFFDVAQLESLLAECVQSRLTEPIQTISLDGKSLRGSPDAEFPGVHLLSAYSAQMQAVLQ